MKKTLFITTLLLGLSLALFTPAYAGTNGCTQQYGGTEACPPEHKVLLDIQVQHPQNQQYVQNLTCETPYRPNDTINFKLNLTNTDATPAARMTLKSVFPEGYTYAGGPGTYDAATRTTTLDITDLQPGHSRTFYYTTRLANPANQSGKALVAENVYKGDVIMNQKTNSDATQFCMKYDEQGTVPPTTKGGQPVYPVPTTSKTPPTGPEALALVALLPGALSGYILRKQTTVKSQS